MPAAQSVAQVPHQLCTEPVPACFGGDGAGNVRVSTANLRLELRQEEEQQQLRGWAWRCPSSSEGAGRRERAAGAGGGACRAADRPEGGKAQQEDVRQRKPAGMNEATWQRVAQWEMLHRGECDTPTVLRFQAKPHDLSRWAREVIRLAATWPTRTRRRPARTCNRAIWPSLRPLSELRGVPGAMAQAAAFGGQQAASGSS
ncbi:hypothetical protein CHLRE_12g526030v5 [Chlamydomonas reinhardtii]|uniref:holocytochrome-c synthase n=1 Tax=Chlamydomonas reinhardtii TaxID=3055 RepID=A0A2K3D4F1_CHLRE|nr:uncharacterized protein CHLRE_12g526030v5 [Chlamydomonas reinhardtii]PNW75412.1 hypothetical protein CHLRE_12g526030v5 [Chlamydomonas reinhardtii]